jgi:hypothetical protein
MAGVTTRCLFAGGAIVILLTTNALAQLSTGLPLETERPLTQEEREKRKEVDDAYKSAINKLPDKKKPADPWGDMRSSPANSSKQR